MSNSVDKPLLPLASASWDESEINAMHRVIHSGNFSMGREVAEFEQQFSQYIGSKYSVMVNSGSSANLLMVAALFFIKESPLQPGDEVIVPAVSWSTTYYPLHQYNLKLRFVDIDPKTLNYDLIALSKAITSRTRLIMAVNLLGNPNEFDEINNLILGTNIFLLEDNCESLGAMYKGKYTGTFGICGSFSTFFSHHMSTMEGGIIVTDNEEIYHILLSIRSHGWTRSLPEINMVSGTKDLNSFNESFKFVLPGYNLRPLELSGAIGKEQLLKLPSFIKQRRSNAKYFVQLFENHPFLQIQKEVEQSSWFGFSFILKQDSNIERQTILNTLKAVGVEYRPIVTGNFFNQPVMKYIDVSEKPILTNADYLDMNGFFIGNHHYDIKTQLDTLYQCLTKIQ